MYLGVCFILIYFQLWPSNTGEHNSLHHLSIGFVLIYYVLDLTTFPKKTCPCGKEPLENIWKEKALQDKQKKNLEDVWTNVLYITSKAETFRSDRDEL